MIRLFTRFIVLAGLLVNLGAQAASIAEQTFDDRVRVGGANLVLNGLGVRAVLWLKGYAAGLYVAEKAGTADKLIAQAGPKRIQLKMLIEVESKEFTKAIHSGLGKNYGDAARAPLRAREAQFSALVDGLVKLRKGDVVNLDYLPGQGLVLSRNERVVGSPIAGEDFYAAILKIFIGDEPVDKALKRGLLGVAPT